MQIRQLMRDSLWNKDITGIIQRVGMARMGEIPWDEGCGKLVPLYLPRGKHVLTISPAALGIKDFAQDCDSGNEGKLRIGSSSYALMFDLALLAFEAKPSDLAMQFKNS